MNASAGKEPRGSEVLSAVPPRPHAAPASPVPSVGGPPVLIKPAVGLQGDPQCVLFGDRPISPRLPVHFSCVPAVSLLTCNVISFDPLKADVEGLGDRAVQGPLSCQRTTLGTAMAKELGRGGAGRDWQS